MMAVVVVVVDVQEIVSVMAINNAAVQMVNVQVLVAVQVRFVQIMHVVPLIVMADNVGMMVVVDLVVDVEMDYFVTMDNV